MSRNLFLIFIGAVVLSVTAFYNRFPLLIGESGSYIDSGLGQLISRTITPVYGYFIKHSSWGYSLWLVVFCQSFLLSLLLYYCFRYLSNSEKKDMYFLIFIFAIAFLTAAPITVSTIGVDAFSCISMLAIGLLLFADRISLRDLFIISTIAIIGIGTNVVNFIACAILIIIFSVEYFIRHFLLTSAPVKITGQRLGLTIALVGGAWLLVSCWQYSMGHTFYFPGIKNMTALKGGGKVVVNKFSFLISDYPKSIKRTATFTSLSTWFNWELREACLSKQYFDGLQFSTLSYVQVGACIVSQLLFILLSFATVIKKRYRLLMYVDAAFLILLATDYWVNGGRCKLAWGGMWLLLLPVFIAIDASESRSTDRSNIVL